MRKEESATQSIDMSDVIEYLYSLPETENNLDIDEHMSMMVDKLSNAREGRLREGEARDLSIAITQLEILSGYIALTIMPIMDRLKDAERNNNNERKEEALREEKVAWDFYGIDRLMSDY